MSDYKIPVGRYGNYVFEFLTDYFYWFFDGAALAIESVVESVSALLLLPHPLIAALGFAAAAYALRRSASLAVGVFLGSAFIYNQGFWEETIETLSLVGGATALSMAIGTPIGVAAAHRPWLHGLLRPALDLMQTLPTFVYLIPALVLFGLGAAPGLAATVIFAAPAPIRLTYLGLTSVPADLIEAGRAFGATKRQLLWKIELPHAKSAILTGLTQCIMLSLSMVVIAALVGADGLGKPVVRALNTVNVPMGLEAGLAIVVLAVMLDRTCRFDDSPRSPSDSK